MKCNIPEQNKPKMPKSFMKLPEYEQNAILEVAKEIAENIVNEKLDEEDHDVVDIMLKLMCIRLVDAFHWTADDLYMFLGNWKPLLRWNNRIIRDGTQEEVINARIAEIFGERGYPQEWVDKLIRGGKKSE